MRPRRTLAAAVALFVAAACTGGPWPEPGTTVSPSPTRRVTPSPSAVPPPIPFTAAAMRRAVTAEALAVHLRRLQAIADENGGIRAAATPGYERSAEYAASVFRAAGFRVRLDRFEMPVFDLAEPSRLEGPGLDLRDGRDFRAAIYSGSGDVTGPVSDAGYGCSSSGFGSGVALVRYGGGCATSSKVRNAQAAGAVAVLVIRSDSVPGAPIRPTLGSPDGVEVPVLALTPPAGEAIAGLGGGTVRVSVRAGRPTRTTRNVVAEIGPRSGPVVMAGGHLDSVIDGPGINDNGSGSAAVLALAQALGRVPRPPRVRLALWSAEEYFLVGSTRYVEGLDAAGRAEIEAYVNLDMIGSPNAA
ncbi:MAG: M28 family peptidase, partial [Actinomycetota bacterium]